MILLRVMAVMSGYGDERALAEGRRRSSLWPSARKTHLETHPVCAACGGKEYLEVHHKVPFSWDPDLELDPTNMITLCEKPSLNCHLRIGHCGNWQWANPRVEIDANASVRSMRAYQVKALYRKGQRY